MPSNFDPGVIMRAHRFRAEMAGFRLERGHYMDRKHDRADRWYVVPFDEEDATRSGSGYRTMEEAADEAVRLGELRAAPPLADDGSGRC